MSDMALKDDYTTVEDAANKLGCTTSHVRFLLNQGTLKGERIGQRVWAVIRTSVNSYAKKHITTGRPRKNS